MTAVTTNSAVANPSQPAIGRLRSFTHQLRTPVGAISAIGTLILLCLAIFAPILWGDQAAQANVSAIAQPPSAEHWLGTDASGRDILLRTLVATRTSLLYGMAATTIGVTLGVLVGCVPTILPARIGRFVAAGINMLVAFPALLLVLFLAVFFGQGATGAVLALGLATVPAIGRLCQTVSASVAGRDFVSAAKVLGVSRAAILFRHIAPSITDIVVVNATMVAATSLTAMAGLSFLGLGLQPPAYDWGRLLSEGLSRLYVAPAAALAPAAAVTMAGIVLTMLGDTIGRALGVVPVISMRKLAGLHTRTPNTEFHVAEEPRTDAVNVVSTVGDQSSDIC